MATRTKTVEFVIQTVATTLAAATKRTQSGTIYLPESSKTFLSVTVEHAFNDDVTGASSSTSIAMGFKLGAVAEDTVTVTDTITNSGEVGAYHVSRDATTYFTTNWTGTSMTFEANTTVGANATNNHSIKVKITYSYDDASATHIKTIWFPIESTRSILNTGYQSVGGSTGIPALKGGSLIMPEGSVTLRQAWVELYASDGNTSTTDYNLDVRLGTDLTEQLTLFRHEAALASSYYVRATWDITAGTLTAAQALEAKSNGVTDRFAWMGGWVGVTYEFAPGSTTTVWNSLILPLGEGDRDQHGQDSTDPAYFETKLWIEEPATITEKTSAAYLFTMGNAGDLTVQISPQVSAKTFTDTFVLSPAFVALRGDSGGQGGGVGLTLGRGLNRLKLTQDGSTGHVGATGFWIVNYTSAKATAGVGAHNQSRHYAIGWHAGDASIFAYSSAKTPVISETSYFLQGVAVQLSYLSSNLQVAGHQLWVEYASGEGPGSAGKGWVQVIGGQVGYWAAENWLTYSWGQIEPKRLKQWASHWDAERIDIETAHKWKYHNNDGAWVGLLGLWATHHAITKTFAGDVSRYTGDGSGITVRVHDAETHELLGTATTSVGGAYSATIYDDTRQVYPECTQGSRAGRGIVGYAS